jgi:peroxiredoxin
VKRNLAVVAVVGAALAIMLWAGIHQARSRAANGPDRNFIAAAKGKVAPEFELKDLQGNTVHLSDYRGKAVLLNFWATWCPPCKEEMPWFIELQKKYAAQGLRVVGIAMDDAGSDAIAKFSHEMGVNYPVLLGTDTVADAYGGVEALPTTFYIARDGRVVKRVFGLITPGEIEDNIKDTLEQQSGGGNTAAAHSLSPTSPAVPQ